MNAQPNKAEFAMALYATACETHQRKDWRQACHALADALKAELMRSAAIPQPANDPAPPKAPRPAAKRSSKAAEPVTFTMTAESLTKALRLLCRVVPSRYSIAILGQALFEARGDVLAMTVTDLDREMTVHVTAPGVGEWSATCEAKALADLLRKSKGAVSLRGEPTEEKTRKSGGETETYRDSRLIISGAVSATLMGRDPADFPRVKADALKGMTAVDVQPAELARALTYVKPAMSTEETRYYLNGAYLCGVVRDGESRLEICATDGSRLHVIDLEGFADAGRIIPLATVGDMLGMLDASAEGFALNCSAKLLQMTAGPIVLTSKLIDGNYPDYRRVIPADGSCITFDAAQLAETLAKVSAISNERSRTVRLAFDGPAVTLTCRNMQMAESAETIPCDGAVGDLLMAFNADYLRAAVLSLNAERVNVYVTNANSPARLESADKGADDRLAIVMPLRA